MMSITPSNPPAPFEARILFRDDEMEQLMVWCYELQPLDFSKRSITDWVEEHIREWTRETCVEMLNIPAEGNCEVVFKGTIQGWYDHHLGEYDEEVSIEDCKHQVPPDDWFEDTSHTLSPKEIPTYYIADDGDDVDGDGSYEKPWKTCDGAESNIQGKHGMQYKAIIRTGCALVAILPKSSDDV